MILRSRKRQHSVSIREGQDAQFLSRHEFLNDDLFSSLSKLLRHHEIFQSLNSFFRRRWNENTFSSRESGRFDYDRVGDGFEIGVGRVEGGEVLVGGGGDVVSRHEGFRERLATFHCGCVGGRTEDWNTSYAMTWKSQSQRAEELRKASYQNGILLQFRRREVVPDRESRG